MIKNLLSDDTDAPAQEQASDRPRPSSRHGSSVITLFDSADDASPGTQGEDSMISPSVPDSADETIRRTGLAWSAGVAFFGAVVFMLVIGWGADVLLGSSPWGIVVGIVLGSVIGFVQFFRISSQIFKK